MIALRAQGKAWILWLTLAAVVYRALIPAGLMPAAPAQPGWLVLCSGGLLKAAADEHPGQAQAHAYTQCAFAASAGPAPLPALPRLAGRAPGAAPESPPRIGLPLPARPYLPFARGPPAFS